MFEETCIVRKSGDWVRIVRQLLHVSGIPDRHLQLQVEGAPQHEEDPIPYETGPHFPHLRCHVLLTILRQHI